MTFWHLSPGSLAASPTTVLFVKSCLRGKGGGEQGRMGVSFLYLTFKEKSSSMQSWTGLFNEVSFAISEAGTGSEIDVPMLFSESDSSGCCLHQHGNTASGSFNDPSSPTVREEVVSCGSQVLTSHTGKASPTASSSLPRGASPGRRDPEPSLGLAGPGSFPGGPADASECPGSFWSILGLSQESIRFCNAELSISTLKTHLRAAAPL